MNLREIASIAGKPGLYRILKPTRTGVIVEALDGSGNRLVAGAQSKISLLSEITMYTTEGDGSIGLPEVMQGIFEKHNTSLPVQPNAGSDELRGFMEGVLPVYDRERVYTSDIKKLIQWYGILAKFAPDVLTAADTAEETETEAKGEEVNG